MSSCASKINEFCYVCGKFTIPLLRKVISTEVEDIYNFYFGLSVYKHVNWAPDKFCNVCYNALRAWFAEKRKKMPFKVPVIWSDPGEHDQSNCYVCQNDVFGLNRNKRNAFVYSSVPSAVLPLPYEANEEGPKKPSPTLESLQLTIVTPNNDDDETYQPSVVTEKPQLIQKNVLDSVVRKLSLSQRQAETLAKELKKAKVLTPNVKVTGYRYREERFVQYFTASEDNKYAYCNSVTGLMAELNIDYNAEQWRLFIDSSKSALKAVLLFHDNSLKPIPLFYGLEMKETYESMKFTLEKISYDNHKWRLICDLKVVALVTGMQAGYTKHCCFLCLWDSRYRDNQYARKEWPNRENRQVGQHNVNNEALVPIESILLPPLHIKLGIAKNFVKALDREGYGFEYLRTIFPRLSEAKLKEGNFFSIKKHFFSLC